MEGTRFNSSRERQLNKTPKKQECPTCHKEVGYKYLKRHLEKCVGNGVCRFCRTFVSMDYRVVAGHSTYCLSNPSRADTIEKQAAVATGNIHTEATRLKISEAAQRSNHRRLRRNTIVYRGVTMDSTWEIRLAERLDELGVEWTRPGPYQWIDDQGKTRHYFPDFYLPEYDIYLDPKNRHAARVQSSKIEALQRLMPNLIILRSLEEIDSYSPSPRVSLETPDEGSALLLSERQPALQQGVI